MDIHAGVGGIGGKTVTETSTNEEFEQDFFFEYDRFENVLSNEDGEDYFDFVLHSEYDLDTVPEMSIIRLNDVFEVPEEFDMINLIDRFKPMLISQVQTEDDGEKLAFENIIGTASADIPILIGTENLLISGKLNTKYLHEDYSSLEDYMDQEVYILCKVIGVIRKKEVEIFDPLKDFIRLPRTARRQLQADKTSIGIDKIKVEGPVLKVEVIAIYK